jgi:diguanylate cyclase (GGDEF)-like protein
MFSCAAFSLVITYNFLEQRMVHLDSLTGAWNRRSFDYYIANRLKHNSDEKMGIIYFDLDKLKYINDSYGHREGDLAIKTSINIIKSVIQKKDIIVRMGGDEFIIVMDCETKEEIDKAVEIINEAFIQFNVTSDMSYKLECSFGADIFNSEYSSIEQFLNHIDNMMYRNKRLKYE